MLLLLVLLLLFLLDSLLGRLVHKVATASIAMICADSATEPESLGMSWTSLWASLSTVVRRASTAETTTL